MPDSAIRLLLDFDAQVARDEQHSPAFLHRRDRRFALDCQEKGLRPVPQQWLAHLSRLSPADTSTPAQSYLRHWRNINGGFALFGTLLGILAMLGLLFYEGGQRINLTVILAFVLLQLLLAGFTSLQSLAGWQPWRRLLRHLSPEKRSASLQQLQQPLMARAAHSGGLCFGLSGLATLLVLVVIQDLAFGWSTTLDTAAQSYHQLLQFIAWPWHTLWPAAVPDLSLVESTRFFRSGEETAAVDPARWGQWWPFVMMVWLCYVVLPRLLLLLLAQFQLRFRARTLLHKHPGLLALQYRMETPALDTGSSHHDAADQPDTTTASTLQPLPRSHVVIRWAGAGETVLPPPLTANNTLHLAAGGRASLEEDRHTIEAAQQCLSAEKSPVVVLVTRSWEPPTAELADFLEQARQDWPPKTLVVLVPLSTDPHVAPAEHHINQWLRFAERNGQGRIQVSLANE